MSQAEAEADCVMRSRRWFSVLGWLN